MSSTATASNTTAPTQILQVSGHSYAYRRFGNSSGLPLLCLQHFTGTLDNWDPAVSDPLASGREVILFDNAGIGRSSGEVPETVAGMAAHVMAFRSPSRDTRRRSCPQTLSQPCFEGERRLYLGAKDGQS